MPRSVVLSRRTSIPEGPGESSLKSAWVPVTRSCTAATMMLGRLESEAGNEVDCVTSVVQQLVPMDVEVPSAKTLLADASPLMTTSFTSAFTVAALARPKTPYVGLAGAEASFPMRTVNIPSPPASFAASEISSCVSEIRGSDVDVPRLSSRLPAEIVDVPVFVLSNWITATIRLSLEGSVVPKESRRPIEEVGTETEAPSLNADFGTEVSTSSSVSQSPAEIVVPVVESAYQHALWPELRVTVLTDVVP